MHSELFLHQTIQCGDISHILRLGRAGRSSRLVKEGSCSVGPHLYPAGMDSGTASCSSCSGKLLLPP